MKKSLFYNLIICVILICFVLVGTYVIMYNNIPTSSIGLEEKTYFRTEEIDAYLGANASEDKEKSIKSYEVNNNDLEQLRKENIYKAGKSNPFGEYKKQMQNKSNIDTTIQINNSGTGSGTGSSGQNINTYTNENNNNEVSNYINPQDNFSRTNVINTK